MRSNSPRKMKGKKSSHKQWLNVSVMHSLQKENAQILNRLLVIAQIVLHHMVKEGRTKTNELK